MENVENVDKNNQNSGKTENMQKFPRKSIIKYPHEKLKYPQTKILLCRILTVDIVEN